MIFDFLFVCLKPLINIKYNRMKKLNLTLCWLFVAVFALQQLCAQQLQPLPVDPKVKYGKLDNGLTYYIRQNKLPENRADFYIAQQVGSILEEDSQAGLAHFLEHMAFNGTKNFPGKMMTNYLETVGVRFGENLNAYTSFDKTVYMIMNAPVTRQGIIDSCLFMIGLTVFRWMVRRSIRSVASYVKNGVPAEMPACA